MGASRGSWPRRAGACGCRPATGWRPRASPPLARRERRGRTLRAVVLSAVVVEHGGTWREEVVFREALADPTRMRLALAPRLALMPAPAQQLRLAVERFGPHTSDQRGLLDDPVAARMGRLPAAIRPARAGAGP